MCVWAYTLDTLSAKDAWLQLLQPLVLEGGRSRCVTKHQQGRSRLPSAAATLDLITPALYPHPKLPWAPQPPGACRQHHCTDTSSEDIDKHPAVGPCAAVPGFRAGQDLLTDAGKALNAEQP